MARRLDYYFRETVSGIRRNGLVAFAAVATVFISLFLFGGAQLINKQVGLVVNQQIERVEVTVYLLDSITPAELQNLQTRLDNMPEVANARYETKAQAYAHAKELFKNQPDVIKNVSPDTFPASFRVKLRDPEHDFDAIKAQLQGQPGVEQIQDNRAILKRLFAVANVLKNGAYLASAVMLLSSIALIGNTVRMAVFARRKEIGIMRLVGATNMFIRVPFLIEALVEGLIGALLAIASLAVLLNTFFRDFHSTLIFIPQVGPGVLWSVVPFIVLGGVLAAVLASLLAMRRFLEV
jgi:cell division transport system permease protein